LAAAFAWAQTQRLPLGSLAIMLIGVGMAVPYAILTSMPGLMNRLPASGRWMELVKQAVGFILLGIAVWLITALPDVRRVPVIYFAVVLGFCVWMWGGWVTYSTKTPQKYLIRILAVILVVAAGWKFLPAPPGDLIDWRPYDPALIEKTLEEKKPVLIKFTANWCLSCKVVDKMVYAREDVANLIELKDVLAIKADTTEKKHPATLALKNKYKEPGVPVSILFLPGKQPVRWYDKSFAGELKQLLEKLPSEK
jgi:thiol:disulfide interchange protein DsbD